MLNTNTKEMREKQQASSKAWYTLNGPKFQNWLNGERIFEPSMKPKVTSQEKI